MSIRRNGMQAAGRLGAACLAAAVCLTAGAGAARADEAVWDDEDALIVDEGGDVSVAEGPSLDEIEQAYDEAQRAYEDALLPVRVDVSVEAADADRIQSGLADLLSEEDPTGSDGELNIGYYIRSELEELGYTVEEQNFHEDYLNEEYIDIPGVNIIAEKGPTLDGASGQILLVCAHYDSKTDPQEGDPLANDKSGAAVLMEAARVMAQADTAIDLCFVFLSGEEDGNFGSARFVENLDAGLLQQVCGVICIGPCGWQTQDGSFTYSLGTSDGSASDAAGRVRAAALTIEALRLETGAYLPQILPDEGDGQTSSDDTGADEAAADSWDDFGFEDSMTSGQEDGSWPYRTLTGGSADAFTQAGLAAVTLSQELPEEPGEEAQWELSAQELAYVTDILTAAIDGYR